MTSLDDAKSKSLRDWPIVLLRVYTGVFFLKYGFGKLSRDNFADGLAGFVNGNLENSFGFFRPFLESVVLPNKGVFAFLVAFGEFAVGIALIIGLATRYAAAAGAVMVASFWFAKGQGFLDAHELIVLGNAIRAARGASLDLANAGGAIRAAVDSGELDLERYESFLRLEEEIEELKRRRKKRQMATERWAKRNRKVKARNLEDRIEIDREEKPW